MSFLLPFLIFLLAVALFTGLDFFFYLLYILFGIVVLGRVWARRALGAVEARRVHDRRIFQGEKLDVRLELNNRSRLPVVWMRLHDQVPLSLGAPGLFRQVVSLGPRERLTLGYRLRGDRRGYYVLGPLSARGGDLIGTATYETFPVRDRADDFCIVYPHIVPLRSLGFPSQSPFGTLPSQNRIFADPTRIRGVRDYRPGDSLRAVDWKTSSRAGSLQVKRYEPAIALETALLLDLDGADYPPGCLIAATELGIVVAASLASHLVEKRQAVGLLTNGRDPLAAGPAAAWPCLPLRKGRDHLMHLLDLLARVELAPEAAARPFLDLVRDQSLCLPWGSTAVLITGRPGEGLFDTLLVLRRRGLGVILVLTCAGPDTLAALRRAKQIGVQAHLVESERDMDVWR